MTMGMTCPERQGAAHLNPDTALFRAAQNGNLAEASTALAQGADVDAACGCEHTAFSWAATNGHTAVASLLIAKGAVVKIPDDTSDTVLTMTAWEKHLDIVSILAAHHANVNQVNQDGGTALWFAVQNQQVDVARTLVAHHVGEQSHRLGLDGLPGPSAAALLPRRECGPLLGGQDTLPQV